jgi:hypothetical protein
MSPAYPEPEVQAANRQSSSLAALAVTLLVVVVSLYLVDKLRAESSYEDCVLSGHASCTVSLSP